MCACWAQRSVTEYNRIVLEKVFFSDFLSYEADGESYLSRIVTGDEWWICHFETQTKETTVGIASCNFFSRLPLQQGKSVATGFFWGGRGEGIQCGQTINWDLYIHTRGTCRSHSGEIDLTKMLLKSSFDTTTHVSTQDRKHRKQSHKSEGLFFRTLHTAPILLPQISTSLEPSKLLCVEKVLGVLMRFLKKWGSGCEYKFQTGTRTG